MTENPYIYSLEFTVRDYEVDLQGIVNNAHYQHYLEHARHQFLLSRNVDFARLHREEKDLIVSRVEIDYKFPLRSNDRFVVKLRVQKEGYLRLVFEQAIFRLPDEKLVVKARVTGVCLFRGKPVKPEDILDTASLYAAQAKNE